MTNVYHHHIHPAKVGLKPQRGQTGLFAHNAPDDEWMEFAAVRGWIVITQDYVMHREDATLAVIKQHGAKVFYLAGADSTKRAVMRLFLNRYDEIVETAEATPGPFVMRVKQHGRLEQLDLEEAR
jgi:predicted nuclease of predicted toxin-antitoxin system